MMPKKNLHYVVCLALIIGSLTSVNAVTDAELEALEKQIEEMETKENQKVELEKKKEAEEKAKRKADQKRKLEAKAEEKRLAELAQKKKEEEFKQRGAKRCAPRILPSNPSEFPDISQLIYNNPAFQNNPAPKVKWSRHNSKYIQETDKYSSRSNGEHTYNYLSNDGVMNKISYQFNSSGSYVHHEDSQYNSTSQTSNSGNYQAIVLGRISILGEGENTDSKGIKNRSSTKGTIVKVDGKLFPLKKGNKLNVEHNLDYPPYKSQDKIEYSVTEVVEGESLNMGLTCDVFVILEQKEHYVVKVDGDYENTSTSKQKYYFSEQLGIVVKYMTLDEEYESVTVLVDYEMLPEFDIKQNSSYRNPDTVVSVSPKPKRRQSSDPEKRKAEVALRLKTKDPEGDWVIDSKTDCAMWNSNPQSDESFTWSGECFDGMLSGKGNNQWFKKGKKTALIKGEYKEGVLNGYGIKSWGNGDQYEGQFLDGIRSGHGIYKWASGDRYEGDWKNNLRHGYGTQSWVSLNQQFEGLWENDKPAREE